MEGVLLTDGSRVYDATIKHSVIGLRSIIGSRVSIESSVMMGADYYETEEDRAKNKERRRPDVGIGEGSVIESALIDKNARIGKNVHIRNMPGRVDSDASNWFVRDGLVIVPKNAIIPDGTVI
jgi:glucose-1-phosphate adenylyltransferase